MLLFVNTLQKAFQVSIIARLADFPVEMAGVWDRITGLGDYEIAEGGVYYHDPGLADSVITWQYTVVSSGFRFPKTQYEKLADLYLLEPDAEESNFTELYEKIEAESFRLTGNQIANSDTILTNQDGASRASKKWNPDGYIKVNDDKLGWMPVEGLKVRANRWFTTKEAVTDSNGYFETESFKHPVNYSIKWESHDSFDLRKGSYFQAYVNGPKKKGRWNQDYEKTNFYWAYASVFRAAYIYYTRHSDWGIKQPPKKGATNANGNKITHRLHIGIKNSNAVSSHYFDFNKFVLSSQVVLYFDYDAQDKYRGSSRGAFRLAIHEIAHASHWQIANQDFNWLVRNGKAMVESWANGVEAELTKTFYPSHTLQNVRGTFKKNIFGVWKCKTIYTPVVEDMQDTVIQARKSPDLSNPCPHGGSKVEYIPGCFACELGAPPSYTSAFVYPNNRGYFYHNPQLGNTCPKPAIHDGANCRYADIPDTWFGFVQNNKFYLEVNGQVEVLSSNSYRQFPVDHVSGYSLTQLEAALSNANGMGQWKHNIKSQNNNPTEMYLDELFGFYNF